MIVLAWILAKLMMRHSMDEAVCGDARHSWHSIQPRNWKLSFDPRRNHARRDHCRRQHPSWRCCHSVNRHCSRLRGELRACCPSVRPSRIRVPMIAVSASYQEVDNIFRLRWVAPRVQRVSDTLRIVHQSSASVEYALLRRGRIARDQGLNALSKGRYGEISAQDT